MKYLILVAVMLLNFGVGFWFGFNYTNTGSGTKHILDSLETINDSLLKNIEVRDSNVLVLKAEVKKLDSLEGINKSRIRNLKEDLKDEIDKTKNYTTGDICDYFDNRYKSNK